MYETTEFPVLSAGPTPRTPLERWDFSIKGEVAEELKWTWDEFRGLPRETVTVDIHCLTKPLDAAVEEMSPKAVAYRADVTDSNDEVHR